MPHESWVFRSKSMHTPEQYIVRVHGFESTLCYSPWSSEWAKGQKSSSKWLCSYLLGDFLVIRGVGTRWKVIEQLTLFLLIPHLSMKEGSLFVLFCFVLYCIVLYCSYEIHRTRMLQIVVLVSLEKLSTSSRGAWSLVPWLLNFRCKSSWIIN